MRLWRIAPPESTRTARWAAGESFTQINFPAENAIQIHPGSEAIVNALRCRDALAVIEPEHASTPLAPVESVGHRSCIHEYAALEH